MCESMTRFIPAMEKEWFGEWLGGCEDALPHVLYSWHVRALAIAVFCYADDHLKERLGNFCRILDESGITWAAESMKKAEVSVLDGKTVYALLLGAIRAEEWCPGALLDFCRSGYVLRWLERLKKIDEKREKAGNGSDQCESEDIGPGKGSAGEGCRGTGIS